MQAHEEIVWVGDTQYGSRGWTGGVLVILFGAALLYGDGVVTPAISVLSAVEGLKAAAPGLSS